MKRRTKKVLLIAVATVCCVSTALIGMMLYGKHQMNKIPGLTFEEALAYTTKDTPEATITVGIIKGGESWYTVYGKDGKILPEELHTYEIGSLTKTFTAALVNKAVTEGEISLSDTIDQYLSLPEGKKYPTIRELLTHTSGYKGYYFESPMIGNFFQGRNDFYGITKEMVLDKTGELNMVKEEYGFTYSNYGYAKLWHVYAVVLDRLCVRHGNRHIAHGIQYLCIAYEADGQQGNGRRL